MPAYRRQATEEGLEAGNKPDNSAERPTRAAMPPKRGHGDLSLKCKGGLRTIVGEGRVENGNSHLVAQRTKKLDRMTGLG